MSCTVSVSFVQSHIISRLYKVHVSQNGDVISLSSPDALDHRTRARKLSFAIPISRPLYTPNGEMSTPKSLLFDSAIYEVEGGTTAIWHVCRLTLSQMENTRSKATMKGDDDATRGCGMD